MRTSRFMKFIVFIFVCSIHQFPKFMMPSFQVSQDGSLCLDCGVVCVGLYHIHHYLVAGGL
jgi:hypothetical protein